MTARQSTSPGSGANGDRDPGDDPAGAGGRSRALRHWLLAGVLVAATGGIAGWWVMWGNGGYHPGQARAQDGPPAAGEDPIAAGLENAEAVARAFLAESDPERRAKFLLRPVAGREAFANSPGAGAGGKVESVIGHSIVDGRRVTAFAVAVDDGSYRLLEVMDTAAGPKVVWESYLRHGTENWEDLLAGDAQEAEVRVFLSPGDYHVPPFASEAEWTCFQVTSPDLPHRVFAYAEAGTVRDKRLKEIVLGAPQFRQHMTLRIARREGPNAQALFEIKRVLAIGWVRGERDVEALWAGD
ncbi:MAG: hypothetical protein HKO57_13520 [Akkermansiaceae bacterium]|nr:hypothetical protein [Akkermansiaceae bacterium]